MNLQTLIRVPRSVRRKIERSVGATKKHRRDDRKDFSEDELIDFLKRNGIRTQSQLESFRRDGDPKRQDYEKVFKRWGVAQTKAFGPPLAIASVMDTVPTAEYMVQCFLRYNLTTRALYKKKQKELPDLVPSVYWVNRIFGSYRKFKAKACEKDIGLTLFRALRLRRKLGRYPSMRDYESEGINMDVMLKWFVTKKSWDRSLKDTVRRIEKGKVAS